MSAVGWTGMFIIVLIIVYLIYSRASLSLFEEAARNDHTI